MEICKEFFERLISEANIIKKKTGVIGEVININMKITFHWTVYISTMYRLKKRIHILPNSTSNITDIHQAYFHFDTHFKKAPILINEEKENVENFLNSAPILSKGKLKIFSIVIVILVASMLIFEKSQSLKIFKFELKLRRVETKNTRTH